MTICTTCGRENPADARFCNGCAAPLADAGLPREERKVVSVLFADLVDFTARAERLDPEDVRALQDAYWDHVRSELERHGGTVEKFIGDAVVALFGAPIAHEDDPERAVRAALAIRDWARDQDEIRVRIAVATGEALVRLHAQPLTGEGMASGDIVNTAGRLQSASTANGIVVDDRTYRATNQVIDYREAASLSAKGKAQRITVWEVVQARSRFGVDVISHEQTPLIGRARELELAFATLARVREERTPQLLTIVGVPGIGKSRLVYELMQAVAADASGIVTWRQGRSLPYGDGVTFWALAEMVKADAGILESDTDESVREKLARGVRRVISDRAEGDWVERHLHPLVGLGGETDLSADRRDETFAAWRRFFEALADWRPLVLVFEDLHWADSGLLDFVDGLVEWIPDVPLLVVATARPELLERRPTWGGGKANGATLSLTPLSEEETERLVAALLDESVVPMDVRTALSAHAAGNALYAEQYVRMLGERRHADALPMPETVQGIIAARLDSLSAQEKSLLQNAAVFGKVFWAGAVLALDGIDRDGATESLHSLQRKEFIQRAKRSSVAGENEYAFRHVLFRDVAYSQVPRAARGEKHGRAASWIESLGRPEDHAEMLAHHYLSALELAQAAGQTTERLVPRARVSLRRAGDRALSVNAFAAAARYFEQALQLWPDTNEDRPRVLLGYGRALFGSGHKDSADALELARSALYDSGDAESAAEADAALASVWWYRGQQDRVDECLARASSLMSDRPASPAKAHVLGSVARFRMLSFTDKEAIPVAEEAVALAEMFDLQELHADTLITLGTARWNLGDAAGLAEVDQGLRIALEINALSAAMRGYNNLASACADRGEYPRRRELLTEGLRLTKRLGAHDAARFMESQLIWSVMQDGAWDDALRSADKYIAECEAGPANRGEQSIRTLRARIYSARGDIAAARAESDKAVALARRSHDTHWLLDALSENMEVYTEAGLIDEARALADEILSYDPAVAHWAVFSLAWVADEIGLDKRQLGSHLLDHVRHHLVWRRVTELVLAGNFEELADLSAEIGIKELEADVRVRAAKALLESGHPDEARKQLRHALVFYRSVGATRGSRKVDELLAQTQKELRPTEPQGQARN